MSERVRIHTAEESKRVSHKRLLMRQQTKDRQ